MKKKTPSDPLEMLHDLVRVYERRLKNEPWMRERIRQRRQEEIELRDRLRREKANRRVKRITLDMIARASDEEVLELFADFTLARIDRSKEPHVCVIRKLPKGFQYLWATDEVNGEVENGGFEQYFLNTRARLAPVALEAFRALGLPRCARILSRALRVRARLCRSKRWGRERIPELERLDDAYYAAARDLGPMQIRFVRAHPELFTTG